MTNFVQQYRSTDLNAPPLQGVVNSLIKGPLNCCLVDGYGWSGVSITGITRSGTTATATMSASDMLRIQTGMILTISGASQSDYNITASVTWASSTTFTYTVANSPTTPATGTILASSFLPITSIARSGTTALVTVANANTSMLDGNYFAISGAAQTDYNITAQIRVGSSWAASTAYTLGALAINGGNLYVVRTAGTSAGSGGPSGTGTAISDGSVSWDFTAGTASTVFTYQVANSPATPATGTLVYMKAGLGWARPLSAGTNSQSYRSADSASNRFYLQVIDNGATAGTAKEVQLYAAEILTADSTPNNGGGAGSGQFPTTTQAANGIATTKSQTADTTQRPWAIVGDDKTFYWQIWANGQPNVVSANVGGFGHFISYKSGDGFNTFIMGQNSFNNPQAACWTTNASSALGTASNAAYVARSYTQSGSSLNNGFTNFGTGLTTSAIAYPNAADGGLYVNAIYVTETGPVLRGRLPGFYASLHASPLSAANYDTASGIAGLSGVTLTTFGFNQSGVQSQVLIDTYGPWT